jgi:hypothetical protein
MEEGRMIEEVCFFANGSSLNEEDLEREMIDRKLSIPLI